MIKEFNLFESKKRELIIGAKVICLNGIQDSVEVGGLIGEIKGIDKNGVGELNNSGTNKTGLMYNIDFTKFKKKNRKFYSTYWVFAELVMPYDEKEYKEYLKEYIKKEEELKKKKEEIRDRMKDVDPYGEEDWLEESIDYFPDKTSISQISFGLKVLINKIKNYDIKEVEYNLDYGGGKYDLGTKYLSQYGINNLIYDKYSRTPEHNMEILKKVKELGGVDSVTLLNVLNTIREKETRLYVIKDAYNFLKPGGVFIITIFKGDKTGNGALSSKKTWQENRGIYTYINEIKEAIGEVEIKISSEYILIKKPEIIKESFQLKTKNGSVIKRSKYGVGKDIGDSIYISSIYIKDIIREEEFYKFINIGKNNEHWEEFTNSCPKILKIKKDLSSISIINSPDFNTSDEPYIKNWLKIDLDGTTKYGEANLENPPIYHHKWLFVKDDYRYFDIEESKRRSKMWLSLPDIDFTRIGYKKYWEDNIVPKIENSLEEKIDWFNLEKRKQKKKEDEEYLSSLIGSKVRLIKRENALMSCLRHEFGRLSFLDTSIKVGSTFTINRAEKIGKKIIISFVGRHSDYDLSCFEILGEVKRKYTEDDPYGEEEWDD